KKLDIEAVDTRLQGMSVPVAFVCEPPVGRRSRYGIRGGPIQRTRTAGQLVGLALLGGAVGAELRIQRFVPVEITRESRDVLGEGAVDRGAGERRDDGVAGRERVAPCRSGVPQVLDRRVVVER